MALRLQKNTRGDECLTTRPIGAGSDLKGVMGQGIRVKTTRPGARRNRQIGDAVKSHLEDDFMPYG